MIGDVLDKDSLVVVLSWKLVIISYTLYLRESEISRR